MTKEPEDNLAIVPVPTSSVTSLKWDLKGSLIPLKVSGQVLGWIDFYL